MEGLQIVVVNSKGRFPSVGEVQDRYFARAAARDPNRLNKIKTDANCAIMRIDKALGHSSKYYTPAGATLHTRAATERQATPTPPDQRQFVNGIERSQHRGPVLDIR